LAETAGVNDHFRFLAGLITRPKITGAVSPSSRGLARAMAREADARGNGLVLELGPGTGPVTRALIERGVAATRIVAVEFNPDFCALLRQRFAGLTVIEGDAYDLEGTLPADLGGPFAAIISSLPLLNREPAARAALVQALIGRLAHGGGLVQFSYGPKPPVAAGAGFTVKRTAFVPFNLPPAQVWLYRAA
jgi:phosphatidylethanolamine/phosphatidyl-N-methylethanolamine N-methyltransferase